MVVKVDKHGNRCQQPPYTQAEEDEFYRRGHQLDARQSNRSPAMRGIHIIADLTLPLGKVVHNYLA
jgi:hypothetical protein